MKERIWLCTLVYKISLQKELEILSGPLLRDRTFLKLNMEGNKLKLIVEKSLKLTNYRVSFYGFLAGLYPRIVFCRFRICTQLSLFLSFFWP